jgi:hypothetical protein
MFSVLTLVALVAAADPDTSEVPAPLPVATAVTAPVTPRPEPAKLPVLPAVAPPPVAAPPAPSAAATPDLTTPVPIPAEMCAAAAPGYAPPPGQGLPPVDLDDRHLGPPASVWGEVNYLLFRLKSAPASVPLLTSPGNGQLLAGQAVGLGTASGGSFAAGVWLNSRHTIGLAVDGFMLEQRSSTANFGSNAAGSPLLVRPFTDALLNRPAQLFVANPGLLAGSFAVAHGARVSGLGAAGVRNLYYCDGCRVDFRVGGRYLDLDEYEQLTQASSTLTTGTPILLAGQTVNPVTIGDRFRTRNQYYGATVGLRGEYSFGLVSVGVSSEIGLGNNHQTLDISGSTRSGTLVAPGGLLALPGANLSRTSTDRLALLTEVGAHVSVQLTSRSRVTAGYQFLYLNNVARPPSQIDSAINTRLVPTNPNFGSLSGIASPIVTGVRDDFFLHGVRLGLELMY